MTQESKRALNIVLGVSVLTYFISVINSLIAINYGKLIEHFYITGITLAVLLIPAYAFKYFVINKIKEKTNADLEKMKLWKKEIYFLTRPIIIFLQNNLGFFFFLVISCHLAALFDIDYKFMKFTSLFGINTFYGMNIWLVMIPLSLIVWFFSFYIIFLSKGKMKNIFPKKIFLFSFFIMSISFAYNINFLISANLHTEIFAKLYKGVVETDTQIAPCEKREIYCAKITIEDLEKNQNSFIPNGEMKYPEVKDSGKNIIANIIKKIKEDKNDTVIYYFTSNFSFENNDEWFAPVIAYNKKTNFLIVDYKNSSKSMSEQRHNKLGLIGLSSMIWIALIMLIELFHDIFLQWRRKTIDKTENEKNEVEKDKEVVCATNK